MKIRLGKVIKECNVGLQTIVEFLEKKGMTVEASPNTVITDEQYEMLKQAFGADKSLKDAAEEERRKHQDGTRSSATEKKAQVAPQEIKTEIPEDMRPRFVTKGHIDLDAPVVATPQPTTPPQP